VWRAAADTHKRKLLQATGQTREISPEQQLLEQWVPESDPPVENPARSLSASWDAYSLAPAQPAPPAQQGLFYTGHNTTPGLQQLGYLAQQASLQPMHGRHAGGPQINGYEQHYHGPAQSYGHPPQGPMFAHQHPAFGQPAVVHAGYVQRQGVGNGQQWHGQSHTQMPPVGPPIGHPRYVPPLVHEHQAWAQGHAPPPVRGFPQQGPPPQRVSGGFRTPSWSSDQSTPHDPPQPGTIMGAHNAFGRGHADGYASGYAVHGEPIGRAAQHQYAYGGAVNGDPWQGPHGHAPDHGQLQWGQFVPVEGGTETAIRMPSLGLGGDDCADSPRLARMLSLGAGGASPSDECADSPRLARMPSLGAGGDDCAEPPRLARSEVPAGAASPFSYAARAPPYAMMRRAVHGAPAATATAWSGGGGSLPTPYQVGARSSHVLIPGCCSMLHRMFGIHRPRAVMSQLQLAVQHRVPKQGPSVQPRLDLHF